ncbi:DUF4150 domain-containing protein [Variovorax sp. J22R133]|uniref:PAAR-like domain-containing protein n=1 Tax=Variovorax brevis TaxID=3053503 RepID=UPI00257821D4|nr:PAAR-like domain-containing protein [Variovorax sp. J22R133]MDM0112270.1 DUF4150 domain-containing protein [Variovorax sp. J22R133]
MGTVGIHPPKTPVTKGSMGIAKATLPNVCKMPGPPAPFIPSPLPNIAKSGSSPQGYSTSVLIEGNAVAIRGAMFESMGDVASKGTGGGLISANTHGPAKFITPGSMTVKIEGKAVHLLSEPMLNNCGPSGSPPNTGATMTGVNQYSKDASPEEKILQDIMCDCHRNPPPPKPPGECKEVGDAKHKCCEDAIKAKKPTGVDGERGYLKSGKRAKPRSSYSPAPPKGSGFPDACSVDAAGNVTQFFDFKFICPNGTEYFDRKSGTLKRASGRGEADAGFYLPARGSQHDKYLKIGEKLNPKPTKKPKCITSRGCGK